jgi:hypothetical protein
MRSRNKGTTRSLVDSYLSSDVSLEKGFHEMKTPSVDTSDDDFRTSFAKLLEVANVAIDHTSAGEGSEFYENMRISLGKLRERFEHLPPTDYHADDVQRTLTSLDRGSQ